MQILTTFKSVRFRAASGEAAFYDAFNGRMTDNSQHAQDGKGSWVTLEKGATIVVMAAYDKGDTYCLLVNEKDGQIVSENTYGMVVRKMSMEKILACIMVDATEDTEAALEGETEVVDAETGEIIQLEATA